MLTVEFSQAAVQGTILRIGCVIRYGENGPVRFAQLVIDGELLDWPTLTDVVAFAQSALNSHLDREHETPDDVALPGL